jgi:hypothetical protein
VFGAKSDPARVAGLTWLAVAILLTRFVRINVTLPGIGNLGSALVAVLFLYAPVFVAWNRGESLDDYGFRAAPVKRGLSIAAAAIAVIFPLFALGYFAFYEIACNSTLLAHRTWYRATCECITAGSRPCTHRRCRWTSWRSA